MPTCVALYDESGNMLRPWAEAGYNCFCYDIEQKHNRTETVGLGTISFECQDVMAPLMKEIIANLNPYFIFGFPPCTDVAVSGAKHFETKMRDDPYCMAKAADLAFRVAELASLVGARWALENPKSMLKHYIGEPDYKFDPFEFGGYLPEDDVHPRWPDYIPPRDAYPKETWIWASEDFVFPEKAPVYCPPGWSPQATKLGGKSEKTKQIRSETPRGFAKAVFLANRLKEL
jgi:hypothetical protein